MKLLTEEEAAKLVNDEDLKLRALANVEQNGIVFLDEIDKITEPFRAQRRRRVAPGRAARPAAAGRGHDVSTKYGMIKTDHILFIASGAFHLSKPSDLIPELQGRFPIRVELEQPVGRRLRADPHQHRCLPGTRQYEALLATEKVRLEFRPDGVSGSPRSPGRSTRRPRTSARAGSTP
jgi:ATP-dependent HslUV protease ATP-binding subunit HslU